MPKGRSDASKRAEEKEVLQTLAAIFEGQRRAPTIPRLPRGTRVDELPYWTPERCNELLTPVVACMLEFRREHQSDKTHGIDKRCFPVSHETAIKLFDSLAAHPDGLAHFEELIAEGRRRREAAAQREALPSTPSRQLQKEVATLCACDENAQQYYDLWDAIEQEERTSVFMTNAERTEHIRARTTKWRTLRARLEPEVAHKIQKAAAAFWSSVPTLRERA